MPIFNYVLEHRRFIKYASDNKLTSGERLLWYALVEIINEESEGNVWTDEFIRISNNRVLTLCDPMGIDTMVRARNRLKQHGLIEVLPGSRNKENPGYRMKLFYPDGYAQNANKNGFYTQNATNTGGNMQGNTGGNMQGNTGGNAQGNVWDIYINQNENQNENETKLNHPEEDEEEYQRLRAHARSEAAAAWAESFGERAAPAILDRIANAQARFWRFEEGVISSAIELAAISGAGNPLGYALKTLGDWKRHHVRTRDDAEEYAFLFRASNGGAEGVLDPCDAMDKIREFSEARAVN